MNAKTISTQELAALVADLRQAGTVVIAPAKARDGKVDYFFIEKLEDAVLGGELPRRSLKEFFMPPTEPLLAWHQKGGDVTLEPVPTTFPPRVILGAKPCDAAALDIVDRVMGWDYHDELWFGRREATTVISLACTTPDRSCFCTAAGIGPAATKGADILLIPVDGGYLAEVVTDKGRAFVEAHAARFAGVPAAPEPLVPGVEDKVRANLDVDMVAIRGWLEGNFEHPFWKELALRCHGCGACASVCPTCHCFDIVDEPDGIAHGVRRRNWDTCQTGRFTVHASGHNPRENQSARYRQRVMHKFAIYPSKFGEVLCTGCGRCARACPGGMDLPEVLLALAALADGGATEVAR